MLFHPPTAIVTQIAPKLLKRVEKLQNYQKNGYKVAGNQQMLKRIVKS